MKSALWRFKFLGLSILVFLILASVFILKTNAGEPDISWVSHAHTSLDIVSSTYGPLCITNTSDINYFVGLRSQVEVDSVIAHPPSGLAVLAGCCGDTVCNGSETCSSCVGDCGVCCRSNPSGIYGGALYSANYNCGGTPACNLYHTGAQGTQLVTSNKIGNSKVGGGCGILKKKRYSQCASLVNANTMCDGDPCVNGIRNITYETPSFCQGTYNYSLNSCIYTGSTPQALGSWGATLEVPPANGSNYYWYWTGYYYQPLPGTVATWGVCGTIVICGDTICSTSYGEDCESCAADCGACPPSCTDNNNQSDCIADDCYWHSYGYECSEYPCYYYWDYDSCTPAGCYWNSYNYNCMEAPCSYIYNQYDCEYFGCYWTSGLCQDY